MWHSLRSRIVRTSVYSLSALLFLAGCQGKPSASSSTADPFENQPPVIHAVQLIPNPPTLAAPLSLAVDAIDPEAAPVSFRFQWYVNDALLPTATNATLDPGQLKRGDRVAVEVVASDGKLESVPFRLTPVLIGNTPPIVSLAMVEPEQVPFGEPLRAKVEVRDPDGDEVALSYRWKRNGLVYKEGTENTLDTTGLKLGDHLQVEVLARDEHDEAKPVLSKPSIVSNGAPRITSHPGLVPDGGQFEYQVIAQDPEGDALTYALESAPPGMQIDKITGRVVWPITAESVGVHKVRIVVSDSNGMTAFQEFELKYAFSSPTSQGA